MPHQYTPMTSTEALESLDVHPALLSADECGFLDAKGYLLLEGILTQDELAAIEGDDAGSELHREEGTVRLANLLDKDPLFEKFITTPRVLAAITHVIGTDIQLSSLSSRAALPNGQGQQQLHTDWREAVGRAGRWMPINATAAADQAVSGLPVERLSVRDHVCRLQRSTQLRYRTPRRPSWIYSEKSSPNPHH